MLDEQRRKKNFGNKNINHIANLPTLKITISDDNKSFEKLASSPPDTVVFKVPAIPNKRKASPTLDIPQLGQRLPTQPSNVAEKSKKEED